MMKTCAWPAIRLSDVASVRPSRPRGFPGTHLVKLSEKGTSNAPSVDLAGIRRPNGAEKQRFGGPYGYVASTSETFRTVSVCNLVNRGQGAASSPLTTSVTAVMFLVFCHDGRHTLGERRGDHGARRVAILREYPRERSAGGKALL